MTANDHVLVVRIERLERQLQGSRRAILALGVLAGVLAITAFRSAQQKPRFTEIDVERINVLEADGMPALIIANSARMPGGIIRGREVEKHRPPASGMLFYNAEGTEAGGLVYTGRATDQGGMAVMSLTFDQLNQDQVIALQYLEEDGQRRQGLQILDRPSQPMWVLQAQRDSIRRMPEGPAKEAALAKWVADQGGSAYGAPRLYVGRDENKASVVNLFDARGQSRLRRVVDSTGADRMEFLDEQGRVTFSLPDSAQQPE